MWMNNDAHENNAKKDGWRSEKNTSAWVHQEKKNHLGKKWWKAKKWVQGMNLFVKFVDTNNSAGHYISSILHCSWCKLAA